MSERRYITVVAVGDDGTCERRWTIDPEHREAKLDMLRGWTGDAYESIYGTRPRGVRVSDWPQIGGEAHVHGVENATFRFPEGVTARA